MKLSAHFDSKEFACKHCGLAPINKNLIDALEDLRKLIGDRPIVVTSGYRCPEHNREIGGVPGSQHVLGNAADIRVDGLTARQLYDAAASISTFGGLGVDDHKNYLHVDVRAHRTHWCYGTDGKQMAWYEAPGLTADA